MKRKLVGFSVILVIALVLTSGTFAYTYTNTSATALNGTFAEGAWATYQPSVLQPDWEQVIPGAEYNTEILLPNGEGDATEISQQFPNSDEHWDKVDDTPDADDYETYLTTYRFNNYETDLYNLQDHEPALEGLVEDIVSITVFYRFAGVEDHGQKNAYARPVIQIYGEEFEGPEQVQAGEDFITKSYEWQGNPATGHRWTWEEIDALQAGISLKAERRAAAHVTQVYVGVNYEKKIIQAEIPEGDLFDITPHGDYTGDLNVKIFLTNTSELIKAYSYLNIELYIQHSIEAAGQPCYRMLSLENGVASFNIEGGSAGIYTVEVWGGAYRLVSSNPSEWAPGWSVTPELYCEVTQR